MKARRRLALCLHRHLPVRGLPNNLLARFAWRHVPDPEAPASVQRWWHNRKPGETFAPPPKFRARARR